MLLKKKTRYQWRRNSGLQVLFGTRREKHVLPGATWKKASPSRSSRRCAHAYTKGQRASVLVVWGRTEKSKDPRKGTSPFLCVLVSGIFSVTIAPCVLLSSWVSLGRVCLRTVMRLFFFSCFFLYFCISHDKLDTNVSTEDVSLHNKMTDSLTCEIPGIGINLWTTGDDFLFLLSIHFVVLLARSWPLDVRLY